MEIFIRKIGVEIYKIIPMHGCQMTYRTTQENELIIRVLPHIYVMPTILII
jgi:hypothetical protein